jgi:hypothetical protein
MVIPYKNKFKPCSNLNGIDALSLSPTFFYEVNLLSNNEYYCHENYICHGSVVGIFVVPYAILFLMILLLLVWRNTKARLIFCVLSTIVIGLVCFFYYNTNIFLQQEAGFFTTFIPFFIALLLLAVAAVFWYHNKKNNKKVSLIKTG